MKNVPETQMCSLTLRVCIIFNLASQLLRAENALVILKMARISVCNNHTGLP